MFGALPKHVFAVILADPAWKFVHWGKTTVCGRDPERYYPVMDIDEIKAMPVADLAAPNCVLFMWITWPMLPQCLDVISAWGFTYKTCAFCWTKADNTQPDFFLDALTADMKLGYWTRANNESCLLATRGHPKRINADVRQAIVEPPRQHSRKPDCVYERIERLVAGPYLELFARRQRAGWTAWGNEVDKFRGAA